MTGTRSRPGRWGRVLASAASICLVVLLGPLAGVAGAHAVVVSSTPAAESRVQDPPTEVTVMFSEAVTTDLGGLEVVDTAGTRVDAGGLRRPSPTELAVDLRPDLPVGTYIASYRVVGVDDHTITGSWVFAVGDAPLDTGGAVQPDGDPAWEGLAAASRALMYLGALAAAGGIIFAVFVLDGAAGRPQLTRLLDVAAAAGTIGLLAWTATQAALASGRGVAAVADPEVLEIVLRDTMGWPLAATLVGLAAIVVAARTSSVGASQVIGFYGAAATISGFALWGHPRLWEPRALAIGSDLAHGASAAIWLGGLASLTVVLRNRGRILHATRTSAADPATIDHGTRVATVDPNVDEVDHALVTATGETVARFSQVAAAALVILWIAGAALAWSALDEPGDLVSTSYGRFVLAKAVLVVIAAGIAAWNRRALVPAIARDAVDAEEGTPNPTDPVLRRWAQLRTGVRAEVLLLTVAVVLTGFLVATPPPSAQAERDTAGAPVATGTSLPCLAGPNGGSRWRHDRGHRHPRSDRREHDPHQLLRFDRAPGRPRPVGRSRAQRPRRRNRSHRPRRPARRTRPLHLDREQPHDRRHVDDHGHLAGHPVRAGDHDPRGAHRGVSAPTRPRSGPSKETLERRVVAATSCGASATSPAKAASSRVPSGDDATLGATDDRPHHGAGASRGDHRMLDEPSGAGRRCRDRRRRFVDPGFHRGHHCAARRADPSGSRDRTRPRR